ncbi:MAG TPA: saccharopine dehydrogenase C-terminal domain-containing protein [Gemmatimonadaceae bacterium]|nr:saccharopine dehydrogenase C-terminal domain-containing protein [Gemmatimonadaceae bacterium]
MRMLVLGAGLQGTACAFDLLQRTDVTAVRLAGLPIEHLPPFLSDYSAPRLLPTPLDVRDHDAVRALMRESDAVLCALPYYFNLEMTRLAIEAGVHFCDLGGNTEIVSEQKALDAEARARRVSVIPDCGVAPGMVNILAQHGIEQLDRVEAVRIFVGGLPRHPEPPLNYQVVYSLEGVVDYYTTLSWILRDGRRTQIPALSEVEPVVFPEPLGPLEAFHTAGGLSTMAFRYEGKIPTMEYKTLRYPGHAALVSALRDLGFFDIEPVQVKGHRVVPRDVAIAVLGERLTKPGSPDIVALRVVVTGERRGAPAEVSWELIDQYDAARGISAMMRTTGFSLAITGWMQVKRLVTGAGVRTPDEAVPALPYVAELAKRDVVLRASER